MVTMNLKPQKRTVKKPSGDADKYKHKLILSIEYEAEKEKISLGRLIELAKGKLQDLSISQLLELRKTIKEKGWFLKNVPGKQTAAREISQFSSSKNIGSYGKGTTIY
jgi:hypothetical protein